MANKIGQLALAASGFFWCFLMWFATAAFSPAIIDRYGLSLVEIGVLASSALWLAPVGRIIAGLLSDKIGARNTFTIILAYTGFFSILSAQEFIQNDYALFFLTRVIVASAGISFVVGIQHVAQWFEENEMGTAQGIYAGTGNAGAGVGALLLPRLYGLDYSSAFLHLGLVALVLAVLYFFYGVSAKTKEREAAAKRTATIPGTLFVWSRWPAIALMLAYAMSFGLEIAMNAWLPGYYKEGFATVLNNLGFNEVNDTLNGLDPGTTMQIAVGTFAAVQSLNASLFRPFSGYMSDVWQKKKWMPYPLITKDLPYSPRIHWLMTALICITISMIGLTIAGVMGLLSLSVVILAIFGICISFGTGSTFAIVPLMFKDRPGTATGFIGGISTAIAVILPIIFAWDYLDGIPGGIHYGYAIVAISFFIPFMIFFMIAFRSSDHPEEHGILDRKYWLGKEGLGSKIKIPSFSFFTLILLLLLIVKQVVYFAMMTTKEVLLFSLAGFLMVVGILGLLKREKWGTVLAFVTSVFTIANALILLIFNNISPLYDLALLSFFLDIGILILAVVEHQFLNKFDYEIEPTLT